MQITMPKSNGIEWNQSDLKSLTGKIKDLAMFPGLARKVLLHESNQTVAKMRNEAPIDTGRLRREIDSKITSSSATIESIALDPKTGIDYAPVREYGLDGHPPQPYFRHNIDLFFTNVRTRLQQTLKRLMQK